MSGAGAVDRLGSARVYRAGIFELHEERVRLPSGLRQDLVVVEHPGAVCIAACTETGELLLVRQYRHAARDWLLELPAGRLERGEEPLEAARRELEEETGFRARSWSSARSFFPAPGFCSELITLFVARDLQPVLEGRLPHDEDEELELVRRSPRSILADGEVRDAKTLLAAGLLLAGTPDA